MSMHDTDNADVTHKLIGILHFLVFSSNRPTGKGNNISTVIG